MNTHCKWRGVDKPGGSSFFAPIPVSHDGHECPSQVPRKCYGTLRSFERHPKSGRLIKVRCDDCGKVYDQRLLAFYGLSLARFR